MKKTVNLLENKFDPINSLQLIALNDYFSDFVKLHKKQKLPKVILLTGDKGIGKFTLAFHLVNYIFTLNSDNPYDYNNLIINNNNSIYKKILSKTLENFNYVGNMHQKKTSVDDIRNIKKKFYKSSLSSLPRFTILDDVELLNLNAANALLKLIEEPSNIDYFILINNKQAKIIETLKSRSLETKIFLNGSDKKKVLNYLLKRFNLEENFVHKFIEYTTPGMLINYSYFIDQLNINKEDLFYETSGILLENYKKTKNNMYLNCIKFLLDIDSKEKLNNDNSRFLETLSMKNKIMHLVDQYRDFNLSNNSMLEHFKIYSNYAK